MERREFPQAVRSWEDAGGFLKSLRVLFLTCGIFLFKPAEAFRQLLADGAVDAKKRVKRAILFAVILGYLRLFFDVVNFYWLNNFSQGVTPSSVLSSFSALSISSVSSPLFLLRPLIVLAVTFILVAVSVKFFLGWQQTVGPALLVVCYKSAADLFFCIPLFGGILAAVWSLMLAFVGIRELYRLDLPRAFMIAVLTPFVILFLLLLSLGPSLNRAVISIYPEMKIQVSRLNDRMAYYYTSSIVSAISAYKKELGFIPAHPGVLKKYLSGNLIDQIMESGGSDGYIYRYRRPDDAHFVLEVVPEKIRETGELVFYADETGGVRFGGPDGEVIRDSKDFEAQLAAREEKLRK